MNRDILMLELLLTKRKSNLLLEGTINCLVKRSLRGVLEFLLLIQKMEFPLSLVRSKVLI